MWQISYPPANGKNVISVFLMLYLSSLLEITALITSLRCREVIRAIISRRAKQSIKFKAGAIKCSKEKKMSSVTFHLKRLHEEFILNVSYENSKGTVLVHWGPLQANLTFRSHCFAFAKSQRFKLNFWTFRLWRPRFRNGIIHSRQTLKNILNSFKIVTIQ